MLRDDVALGDPQPAIHSIRSHSSQFGVDFSNFLVLLIRDHPRSSAVSI